MKKVLVVVLILALLLVGCTKKGEETNKRFEIIYEQGFIEIILDTETGVKYLYRGNGYGSGLTRLWEE